MESKEIIGKKLEKPTDIIKYLDEMKGLDHEIVVVFCLDENCVVTKVENIISESMFSKGNFSSIDLYHTVKDSAGFIMVHNHTNGIPVPSKDDIETTEWIKKEYKNKGILFIEHYIYGNGIIWGIMSHRR